MYTKLFPIVILLLSFKLAVAQVVVPPELLATPSPAPTPTPTPVPTPAPTPVATEALKFFGDFRFRHQTETQSPKETRGMERFQAHFGVNTQIEENLKATLRLKTGSGANSGNQTLGDEKSPGMPRRNFGIDLAYFDFQPIPGLNINGGKMPQPFVYGGKSQMLLDRDITPEGLAIKYALPLIEKELEFFVQGGTFWVRENYDDQFGEDTTDNMLNGGQVGLQWKPQDWTLMVGVGTFGFTGLKDTPPTNLTTGGKANGNTLDLNGNYPTNFDIEQKFVELKHKIGSVEMMVFAELLENIDAANLNKAKSYGLQLTYKSWILSWVNQEVEKDAVVGLFTDSDFAGGVTSSKGKVWSLAYKFTKKVSLQYTTFDNENGLDLTPNDYKRTHLDLSMTF